MIAKATVLLLCASAVVAGDITSICAKLKTYQLLPHENCNQFYQCTSGGAVIIRNCTIGLKFNAEKRVCDLPENVNCNRTSVNTITLTEEFNYEKQAAAACDAPSSEGLLLLHRDCNRFFQCAGGIPYEQKCPESLLFNSFLKVCDWPENLNCGNRNLPTEKASEISESLKHRSYSASATVTCAVPSSEHLLLPHANCDEFFECSGGAPVALKCVSNLLYNLQTHRCDFAEKVDCSDRIRPHQNVSIKIKIPYYVAAREICAKNDSGGMFLPHENCNQLYQCAGTEAIALKCPFSLLYNNQTHKCDFPENVDCGDRKIPSQDETPNSPRKQKNNNIPAAISRICDTQRSELVLLPHENCDEFYKCAGVMPVALKCPYGFLYNPVIKQCDFPESVECGNRKLPSSNATSSIIPQKEIENVTESATFESQIKNNITESNKNKNYKSVQEVVCAQVGSDGILLPHENCHQYYKCAIGVPVTLKCSSGLLYNPITHQCDFAENVNCSDNDPQTHNVIASKSKSQIKSFFTSQYETKSNISAQDACAQENLEGLLLPHENCHEFYECAGGVPLTLACPTGLLYNSQTQQCDYLENVDCGNRKLPPRNVTSRNFKNHIKSNISSKDICSEVSDGQLYSSQNCDEFYKCSGLVSVVVKCPYGLLYNLDIQQCDFPENVDCGDRKLPSQNASESDLPQKKIKSSFSVKEACNAAGGEILLMPHENCDEFYECDGPVPVTLKCPYGLLYNPKIQQCDFEENVDCGKRNPPTWNATASAMMKPQSEIKSDFIALKACAKAGSDGLLLPHMNCSQFYECARGLPMVYHCPKGLLYNPIARICDWPENINCGNRTQSPVEKIIGENRLKYTLKEVLESIANTSNAQNEMKNAVPEVKQYNSIKNEVSDSEFFLDAVDACVKNGSNGLLLPHENCDKFYECVKNRPVARNCPVGTGLLYNPRKQLCTFVGTVDCGDRIRPSGLPNLLLLNASDVLDFMESPVYGLKINYSTSAAKACAENGSEGLLLPHENCEKFYECAHGNPVVIQCAAGLLYKPETQKCDWMENIDCEDRIQLSRIESSIVAKESNKKDKTDSAMVDHQNNHKLNALEICAEKDAEGLLLPHDSCSKYYECTKGKPAVADCPAGLFFNFDVQQCDRSRNMICEESENNENLVEQNKNTTLKSRKYKSKNVNHIKESKNKDETYTKTVVGNHTTDALDICADEDSEGLLLPHDNCRKYYECTMGIPVVVDCPAGLFFNLDVQQCNREGNAFCDESEYTDPENKKITLRRSKYKTDNVNYHRNAVKHCSTKGNEELLLPHMQCELFYECVEGQPVTLDCPTGMLFNSEKQICERSGDVNCDIRIRPEEAGGVFMSY